MKYLHILIPEIGAAPLLVPSGEALSLSMNKSGDITLSHKGLVYVASPLPLTLQVYQTEINP
jgi:hypothetical protein